MRIAHKVGIAIAAIVLLLLTLLLPRAGHADQSSNFGDLTIRYSAISTDQLPPEMAQRYGFERSSHRGLVNIAVEKKPSAGAVGAMIAANVSGSVADLSGHKRPIGFRQTQEDGQVDYLGEFPLDGSGTYVFTIQVSTPGQSVPYTVKFNRDYVLE